MHKNLLHRSIEANMNDSHTTLDGMEYIAGFIAKKLKTNILSQVTTHMCKITIADRAYNLPSWVQQLSFSGLVKPSAEFLNTVHKWNKHFEIYHGQNLRKDILVVKMFHSFFLGTLSKAFKAQKYQGKK